MFFAENSFADFVQIILISGVLVAITSGLYYEILRIAWDLIPRLHMIGSQMRVIFVVFAIFLGHTAAVWFYALVYWFLTHYADYGTLIMFNTSEAYDGSFETALYFSSVTYSSLGYGEIIPEGPIRIMAGIQVVNGLVLIGWSVSFTYLAMERFWDMHKANNKRKKKVKKKFKDL